MRLIDFFEIQKYEEDRYYWSLINQDPKKDPEDILARELACQIMNHHLRAIPEQYSIWKENFDNPNGLSDETKVVIRAFIKPVFGIPDQPDNIPEDNIEGLIAEYLWYFINLELYKDQILLIDPPKFKATDHGGDGIVIHQKENGDRYFRLWETKKNTQEKLYISSINSTINNACSQLSEQATEYLARYSTIAQEQNKKDLAEFCSNLVEMWIEGSEYSAAGVSVSTNIVTTTASSKFFHNIDKYFPKFTSSKQLEGMLNTFKDFSSFCHNVRIYIWTGL